MMIVPRLSVINTFWYVAVGSLLVYPAWSQEYREQELLYVEIDDGVQFLLVPYNDPAVDNGHESMRLGLTRTLYSHKDKAESRDRKPKKRTFHSFDFIPHNTWTNNNTAPTKATILRLDGGETSEYTANVVWDGQCFDNIKLYATSFASDRRTVSEEVSALVKQKLEQACKKGFTGLNPSPRLAELHGIYSGQRQDTDIELKFRDGVIKKADLVVDEFGKKDPVVSFWPVCAGILAVVTKSPDAQQSAVTVILERSTGERTESWRKKLLSFKKGREELAGDSSHALCNIRDHGRRRINRNALHDWDVNLPEGYVLEKSTTEVKVRRL